MTDAVARYAAARPRLDSISRLATGSRRLALAVATTATDRRSGRGETPSRLDRESLIARVEGDTGRWLLRSADVVSLRVLRRARDRIDRDYAEQIDIPALAAGAGYSREHFIRAFRTTYGETPGRYRTRRRVERACELLRSANLTVTEICHLVGFTSLGTFSARFAELTGMSPTEYRRQAAERGGPAPIPGCFALMWRAGLPEPRSTERITS